MARSPAYQDIEVIQLAVGAEKDINTSGMRLAILSASEPFELSFGDDAFFYAEAGLGYRPIFEGAGEQTFKSLRVRNTGIAPLDVRMQVGTGEIVDNRAVFGGGSVPVAPAAAAIFEVQQKVASDVRRWSFNVLPGTWNDVKPADPSRRAISIVNKGTETVWLARDMGPSPDGIPCAPGQTVRIETTSAIRASNSSAIAIPLVGFEEFY